jgi:DNA-binding NtrC family response regulator
VSIVANQIAAAINNARLYEDRRRAVDELQAMNSSLEARVAERTAALERELRVAQELVSDARSRADGPLLGDSAAVRTLREEVTRQAARMEPLLLAGPGGAGKEAVAHAVHVASGRNGAFIYVSCPELHRSRRAGRHESFLARLELASRGTLFLDAIHELPAALQNELADILEKRVGSAGGSTSPGQAPRLRSGRLDFARQRRRVIARCCRPARCQGSLIEPLVARSPRTGSESRPRGRREDIPVIVDYFVSRQARQIGKVVDGISPESSERLQAYSWPGNVRELRTMLERAILVAKSSVLEIDEELLDDRLAVGSYRLIEPLGSGGMGEVWRAASLSGSSGGRQTDPPRFARGASRAELCAGSSAKRR